MLIQRATYKFRFISVSILVLFATGSITSADIFRWDNGQLIPGTEGITPGPGVQLDSHELAYAALNNRNLTGSRFDFSNLSYAWLYSSTLTNANLSGAVVTGADFYDTTSRGFTKEQLYSTASYQAKNLAGIGLGSNDLSGWDLSGQNLANAALYSATLTNANLSGAVVTGANFYGTTSRGFTKEQFYSTASYQQKNLAGIGLGGNDLSGWDFRGQNLANAYLDYSTFTNANLAGANLTNAYLPDSTLTSANLAGANLTNAYLPDSTLTSSNLSGANLANADLWSATLTDANLSGAVVTGADFASTTSRGFTKEQLYSTASYEQKNLQGIGLGAFCIMNCAPGNDLSGWDFSGQNLANASLLGSTLTNANLSGADTRGAQYLNLTGATSRNAILPAGTIAGLNLAAGDQLVVRDDDGVPDPPPEWQSWLTPRPPIPITVHDHFVMSDGGMLRLVFEADPWDSLISFQPGIPVQLGGTLELTFADDVAVSTQVGRTLHVFDWSGVAPAGEFVVASPYLWDLSRLYSSGEVTLLAIPEPSAPVLMILAGAGWCLRRGRAA